MVPDCPWILERLFLGGNSSSILLKLEFYSCLNVFLNWLFVSRGVFITTDRVEQLIEELHLVVKSIVERRTQHTQSVGTGSYE